MHDQTSTPQTVRLAQDACFAVDMCPCGTLTLHVGAFSLRLEPEAFAGLIDLLGLASSRRQMLLPGAAGQSQSATPSTALWAASSGDRRGKA
jgi:hypothetical protein